MIALVCAGIAKAHCQLYIVKSATAHARHIGETCHLISRSCHLISRSLWWTACVVDESDCVDWAVDPRRLLSHAHKDTDTEIAIGIWSFCGVGSWKKLNIPTALVLGLSMAGHCACRPDSRASSVSGATKKGLRPWRFGTGWIWWWITTYICIEHTHKLIVGKSSHGDAL